MTEVRGMVSCNPYVGFTNVKIKYIYTRERNHFAQIWTSTDHQRWVRCTDHHWLFVQVNRFRMHTSTHSSHRELVWLLRGDEGCTSGKSDLNTYPLNSKHVPTDLDLIFLLQHQPIKLALVTEMFHYYLSKLRGASVWCSLCHQTWFPCGWAVFSISMHSVLANHQPAAAVSGPIRQWVLQCLLQSVHLLVCKRRHLSIWNLCVHIQLQLILKLSTTQIAFNLLVFPHFATKNL